MSPQLKKKKRTLMPGDTADQLQQNLWELDQVSLFSKILQVLPVYS